MKYCRIKKNADFQKMFKKGKKVFSPYMTLLYLPSKNLSFGVAVSKKHGKAVKRNRIKRLLRSAFSEACDNLSAPYSVIIIPKPQEDYSYKAFKESLDVCFKKINICRKN